MPSRGGYYGRAKKRLQVANGTQALATRVFLVELLLRHQDRSDKLPVY